MAREASVRARTREVTAEQRPKSSPRNLRVRSPGVGSRRGRGTGPRAGLRERVRERGARLAGLGKRLVRPGLIVLRGLSVLLVLGGAVGVGRLLQHHLTTSKAFAIDRIDVKGLVRIERDELLDAAGIELGTNVFALGPEEVRARLLAHPWIAAAQVSRRLPSQFAIEVREREPVALLVLEPCEPTAGVGAPASCDEPSSLYLVSEEGKVFKRLEGEDPVDLPVMTGLSRQRFGTDPAYRETTLLRAVSLLAEFDETGLRKRAPVSELHVEADDGLSLYVGEDLTHVRLGHPPYEHKLRRMGKVFERLDRERASAEYVYLDNEKRPDRVTVRLR